MTAQPQASMAINPNRRKTSPLQRREAIWGLAFLAPWIIGFLIFTLLPMIASLIFSFTNFNLVRPQEARFIGLDNYAYLFKDPLVRHSMLVSLRFALVIVPISLAAPLVLAAILHSKNLIGKRFFRTLFFLPRMVPVVSAVYIWSGVLNPQDGWVNKGLGALGIQGPDWFRDPTWIYFALTFISVWGIGTEMIISLAAMQGVPTELYEAARIDGAGPVRSFFSITLPMITPVIFYNLTLALIGVFQYFTVAFALTSGQGGTDNSMLFFNIYLYQTAFGYNNMGYGATLAWLIFTITLVLTIILFWTSKRWVYYAGGER